MGSSGGSAMSEAAYRAPGALGTTCAPTVATMLGEEAAQIGENGNPRRRAGATRCSVALLLALAAVACGGGQTRGHPLDRRWNDVAGEELAAFRRAWQPTPPPLARPLAAGVTGDGTLVGLALDEGTSWRSDRRVSSGPFIARNLVVATGDAELFAIDGITGELLWSRPCVGELRGADDDGETTVASVSTLDETGTIVLAVARDGRVVRQLDVPERVGAPAVVDEYAFLPWDDQLVVIFDLAAGSEAARIVSADPLRRALVVGPTLWFGEASMLAFDERVVAARRGRGTTVSLPAPAQPGRLQWLDQPPTIRVGGEGRRGRAAAYARPRLTQQAGTGRGGTIAGDRYVVTAGAMALGLDADRGTTCWVHVTQAPILAAAASADGFLLCTASGAVVELHAATGAARRRSALAGPLSTCAVRAGDESGTHGVAPPAGAAPAGTGALADQLAEALWIDDPRLLPVQLDLLTDLAALVGNRPTGHLIRLATDQQIAARLRDEARRLLARRRSGAEAMMEELRRRPPCWLCRGRPIPLAELAQALGAIGDRRAAPLLAAHLLRLEPETPEAVTVARALRAIATSDQRWALRLFVALHHCATADRNAAQAVLACLEALAALGPDRLADRLRTSSCIGDELRDQLPGVVAPRAARPARIP